MPWFKVDDGFHGHPKVVELSMAAVGVWTLAGAWCAQYLTDGEISAKTVRRLGGEADMVNELVEAGLWEETDSGYLFHDWLAYQPSKDSIEDERNAARDRMRAVRAAKKGVRPNTFRTEPERSAEQPANFGKRSGEVRSAPALSQSHPDPIPSLVETEGGGKRREIRIPADWAPSASHYDRAKISSVDIAGEAERFKLHAATHDRHAVNWNAAFTSWLIKATSSATVKPNADAWMQPRGIGQSAHRPPRASEVTGFCDQHAAYPLPCDRCDEERQETGVA